MSLCLHCEHPAWHNGKIATYRPEITKSFWITTFVLIRTRNANVSLNRTISVWIEMFCKDISYVVTKKNVTGAPTRTGWGWLRILILGRMAWYAVGSAPIHSKPEEFHLSNASNDFHSHYSVETITSYFGFGKAQSGISHDIVMRSKDRFSVTHISILWTAVDKMNFSRSKAVLAQTRVTQCLLSPVAWLRPERLRRRLLVLWPIAHLGPIDSVP